MDGLDQLPQRLAVIGGGYTGAAFVVHAVRAATGPLVIDVVEPAAEIGRGIAYGTTDPAHRINVPSDRLSLFTEDPTHLTRWLFDRGVLPDATSTDVNGHHYVPRSAYGDYVAEMLRQTIAAAGSRVQFRHRRARAAAIRARDEGWDVELSDGNLLEADAVVLCCGHAAPTPPSNVDAEALRHPGFIRNPWTEKAFAKIRPHDSVLVVGTGLTMADVVASLDRVGHAGPITAISRRRLLAQPHGLFLSDIDFLGDQPAPTTALGLLRLARSRVRQLGPTVGWQPVMDALRFILPRLWSALPARERRLVARRLLPFWEVHRFRVAPQLHELLCREVRRGHVTLEKGSFQGLRVRGCQLTAAIRAPDRRVEDRDYDHVVLCTGPGKRLETDPLVVSLLSEGIAAADAVGLGLQTNDQSRIIRPDGGVWTSLVALGPITRGSFGEMTGAPDILRHINRVVEGVLIDGARSPASREDICSATGPSSRAVAA